MRWKNTPSGYGSLSMALHWLMLLLIAAVYASMVLKGFLPKGSASRETMATWHYMLGLAVFVLVWLRWPSACWDLHPPLHPHRLRGSMPLPLECTWRCTR